MFFAELIQLKKIGNIVVNFLPSWWNGNYGVTWGDRMACDADYRIDTDRDMRRLLRERFPDLPLGERDPKPRFVHTTFNNALTPAAFGLPVRFPENLYAQWEHALSYDALLGCDLSDVWSLRPYREIRRQTEYMNGRLGTDEIPFLPPMGVLNGAVQLLGDLALCDLADEGSPLPRLFELLAEHESQKLRMNAGMGWRGAWYLFNCSVDMIGPETYRRAVLPWDAAVAESARRAGCGVHLHHCGTFDRYAGAYTGLGPLYSLEAGFTSDPALAAAYPMCGGPLYVILDHRVIRSGSRDDVARHVGRILDGVGGAKPRLTLLALDLDCGMPDDNIRALFEAVQ